MTKIKIIREVSKDDFAKKIQKSLSKGWEIKGEICIDNDNNLLQMISKNRANSNDDYCPFFKKANLLDMFITIHTDDLEDMEETIEDFMTFGWEVDKKGSNQDNNYFSQRMIKKVV